MPRINIRVEHVQIGRLNRLRQSPLVGDTYEAAIEAAIAAWEASNGPLGPYSVSLEDMGEAFNTKPGDAKYNELCDLTGDKFINSGDQYLGSLIGLPATITPPPPTGGYTVEQLIADAGGLNDGTLCPPVDSYDWGQKGDGCTGKQPTYPQVTGWWTAQWKACGQSTPATVVEFRNFKTLAWYGGADWRNLGGNWDNWMVTCNPNTSDGFGTAQRSGAGVVMPTGQKALHGATNRMNHNGARGIVTVFEARIVGAGQVIVCAGADHIDAGAGIQPRLALSKHKLIRTDWTPLGCSSVTAANLRAFPPPLP